MDSYCCNLFSIEREGVATKPAFFLPFSRPRLKNTITLNAYFLLGVCVYVYNTKLNLNAHLEDLFLNEISWDTFEFVPILERNHVIFC